MDTFHHFRPVEGSIGYMLLDSPSPCSLPEGILWSQMQILDDWDDDDF
jgi:hypothetical protein